MIFDLVAHFLESLIALLEGLLWKMVGFSSHGRLVAFGFSRADYDSVDWDVHSSLNFNDVSNHDVVIVDSLELSISECINL